MQVGKQPFQPNHSLGSGQSATSSTQASQEKPFQISAPTIPPPKGGGAIPGTGERFAANLLTLGCEVIAIARNKCTDAVGDVKGEKYLIFPGIEAEGQPLEIRDARGNLVMQHIKNGQGER